MFQIISDCVHYMTGTFDSSRRTRPHMVLFSFYLKVEIESVSELLCIKVCTVLVKVG
jgi:hypothetical protein